MTDGYEPNAARDTSSLPLYNRRVTPLLVFGLAALVSFLGTPYVVRLAQRLNAVDVPDRGRRFHRGPTARLGGLVLAAGFGAAVGLSFVLPVPRNDDREVFRLGGLLVGLVVV